MIYFRIISWLIMLFIPSANIRHVQLPFAFRIWSYTSVSKKWMRCKLCISLYGCYSSRLISSHSLRRFFIFNHSSESCYFFVLSPLFFLSCVSELPLAKMKVVTVFRKPAVVMFRAWTRSFAKVDTFACELRKEYRTTIRFVSHIALSFF